MKNKFCKTIIYAILVGLFGPANFAYALPNLPVDVKTSMVKLTLAMFGVVVFSIIISIGLSIYNRIFVPKDLKDLKLKQDSLKTPLDKEEAILAFISKNRLK